jgi:hypothetical protein
MNNMAVYAGSLNFKHGGILKMAVYLNFKDGGSAVYLNCNRAVYLNFKYGGIFKDGGSAVYLNFKDGFIFEF